MWTAEKSRRCPSVQVSASKQAEYIKVLVKCNGFEFGVYRNGEAVSEMDDGFESGTEITFNCIVGAAGERTTWKIICEDGVWIGRSQNCGELEVDGKSRMDKSIHEQYFLQQTAPASSGTMNRMWSVFTMMFRFGRKWLNFRLEL